MLVGPAGSPSKGTIAMGTAVPAPPTISMVSWARASGRTRRNRAASATMWRNERCMNSFLLDPFATLRSARVGRVTDYNEEGPRERVDHGHGARVPQLAHSLVRGDGRGKAEGAGQPVGDPLRFVALRVRPDIDAIEAVDLAHPGLHLRRRKLRLHVCEESLRVVEVLERSQLHGESAGGLPADRRDPGRFGRLP